MRRFLITGPGYEGEAEVIYDSEGRLVRLDAMQTTMTVTMVERFKSQVPSHVKVLPDAFASTRATIVESTYEVEFTADFWNAYGHKVNKKRCEPLWAKLSIADRIKAAAGIAPYKKYLASLPYKRAIADPEKYLKDRYWENEWK